MEIIITEWALNSYLDLKQGNVFSDDEYKEIIRPDVLRLLSYPNDPKFTQGKFWSRTMPEGYKMKWHQIGNGLVQLRLTVGIIGDKCFLCEAYVKRDDKTDQRKLARFKTYLQLICMNRFIERGKLT